MNSEEKSPVLVMKQIAAKTGAYQNISYSALAKVTEQWPMMGRNDLYYAGTSYENEDGLGIQLSTAADRGEELSLGTLIISEPAEEISTGVKVVPVTALYDRGEMLRDSKILANRLAPQALMMHPDLAKSQGINAGDRVKVAAAGWEIESGVILDDQLPEDVALVARSNGLPVNAPVFVQIQRLVLSPEA
jgi:NADH-quinone oxidoreductase subunit G